MSKDGKRPYRLRCVERVKKGDGYVEICRYSGAFKSTANAFNAAERWALENDYEKPGVYSSCGYSIETSVAPVRFGLDEETIKYFGFDARDSNEKIQGGSKNE